MRRTLYSTALVLAAVIATNLSAPRQALAAPANAGLRGNQVLTWTGCGITRKAFMSELAAAYERKTGIRVDLSGGGATKGIRDTQAGLSNLGGSCRWTLENPRTLRPIAAEAEVKMVPVAWDALVAIVNPLNPIDTISMDQIRQVYTGAISNWKALGGIDAPVHLYVREGKISGVGHALRKLVFTNFDQEFTDAAKRFPSSGPLEKAVESDPNGIAVTGVGSARRRAVKILALDGIDPNYDNIRNGQYMLYRPMFLVIRKYGATPEAKAFIKFAASKEGRQVIRDAGTIPYRDGMALIAKQIKQQNAATERGLYRNKAKSE
jgi:phosphate transport system substrate-binding protein